MSRLNWAWRQVESVTGGYTRNYKFIVKEYPKSTGKTFPGKVISAL